MERPLALHTSALSEAEFNAYSSIVQEIVPPGSQAVGQDWERIEIPLGEAKGWIRGKYGVDAGLLDQILRFFPTTTGSVKLPQFFAVLRLVSHVRYGGERVDKSLVFVQAAHPLGLPDQQALQIDELSRSTTALSSSPRPRVAPPPPPVPFGTNGRARSVEVPSNPFRRSLSTAAAAYTQSHAGSLTGSAIADEPEERHSPTSSLPAVLPNGTIRPGRTSSAAAFPTAVSPPRTKKMSSPEVTTPAQELFSPSKNPFLTRTNSNTLPVAVPPLPPRKPASMSSAAPTAVLPPPRHPPPPPKPAPLARKPSHTHNPSTSALIRQSLMSAKTAQKSESLQQFKTMEVIKSSQPSTLKERARNALAAATNQVTLDSSSSTPPLTSRSGDSSSSSQNRGQASTSSAPVPPPRPPPMRQSSRSTSPTKPSPIKSNFVVGTPSAPSVSGSVSAASEASSSASRPARSKSLHASPTSAKGRIPTPPPRRRPGSVQVLASGSPFAGSMAASIPSSVSPAGTPLSLSRRSSVQHTTLTHGRRTSHSPSSSPPPANVHDPFSSFFSTMRQTVKGTEGLLTQQGEHFNKFGRKVEGGLAPGRGYISHRGAAGERLMAHQDDEDEVGFDEPGQDKRRSVDSDTPGMDTNPNDDDVDWNEWERSESLRGRGSLLARTISSDTATQRQAGRLQSDADVEEVDYRMQRVDGWRRLG